MAHLTLVRLYYGSRLYGTQLPTSDVDIKGVYIPDATAIVHPRTPDGYTSNTGPKDAKNAAGDVDDEMFALHKFMNMIRGGEMIAYEMLFAPPDAYVEEPHPIWETLVRNRSKLLTRKCKGFIGYVQRQASVYSVRGDRVNASEEAYKLFERLIEKYGTTASLAQASEDIGLFMRTCDSEHIQVVPAVSSKGNIIVHFECCDRKTPFTASLKTAYDLYKKVYDDYGHRARAAAEANGVDWKALYHAIRIARQTRELLVSGNITFPRPDKDYLLAIRKGEVPYQDIADELEGLLKSIEPLAEQSSLPAEPDHKYIDNFVQMMYLARVRGGI